MLRQKPLLGELPDWTRFPRPVALWPGIKAGNLIDISGNRNNGTLSGNTFWVPGKFGPALQFDGATDVINLGTNPKLGFTSEDFTVYIYFKITDSSESDWLYSKGQANNDGFYIQARNDKIIRVATCQDGAQQETDTSTTFSDNVWHSLFVVRKGNYIYIYLDGVECSYSFHPAISNPDDASARIAYISGYFGDYGIIGLISHGAVWNGSALTASQIARLCWNPFPWFVEDEVSHLYLPGGAPAVKPWWYYKQIESVIRRAG